MVDCNSKAGTREKFINTGAFSTNYNEAASYWNHHAETQTGLSRAGCDIHQDFICVRINHQSQACFMWTIEDPRDFEFTKSYDLRDEMQ
jgi:hypothetical protein